MRDAAAACDQLNQSYPDYEPGWILACKLAMLVNEPLIALRAIDRALQLSPGKPEWLLQRLECLGALGDTDAALLMASQLGDHAFAHPSLSSNYGLVLTRLGLYELARTQYRRACELEPDNGTHFYNLASVERFLGNLEAAEAAVGTCLELSPDDANAHLLRAGLRTQTTTSNHVDELQRAYAAAGEKRSDRVKTGYALAKELEDLGEYERSFAYLAEASKLRRSAAQYNPEIDIATMREIRATFTQQFFARDAEGHVSAEPIFVIGMPRTGTTLVDRILGSHSVVHSAGELQAFAVELTALCGDPSGSRQATTLDMVHRAAEVDFAALGENYIAATRPATGSTAHFVDKLPLNFLYAGLIHRALPKAKIILLERDPMDTCYAVFKTLFLGIYPYSYDLEELAKYYVAYRELIDHWQSVMPGVMHTVRYEELVTEPRPVIENLLEHCNLSFEDACLAFQENPAAVTTASAAQVRSGFSTGSIGNWRNYRKQLQPVADILRAAGVIETDQQATGSSA